MGAGRLAFWFALAGALPGAELAHASKMFFANPPAALWLYGLVIGAAIGLTAALIITGASRRPQPA